jgi:hypothetical protein
MEGFLGRNCVYIVVNVCLGLFPAHRGRGSGVQVQHRRCGLFTILVEATPFLTVSYFFAITPVLCFWARKGVLFSSSLLNLIWVLGQRDQSGGRQTSKEFLEFDDPLSTMFMFSLWFSGFMIWRIRWFTFFSPNQYIPTRYFSL